MVFSILPKNEKKKSTLLLLYLKSVFVRFLRKLKTPTRHFEINLLMYNTTKNCIKQDSQYQLHSTKLFEWKTSNYFCSDANSKRLWPHFVGHGRKMHLLRFTTQFGPRRRKKKLLAKISHFFSRLLWSFRPFWDFGVSWKSKIYVCMSVLMYVSFQC